MADLHNFQRVLGVRVVDDGTIMHNNQIVIGIVSADEAATFVNNIRVIGVDVLGADAAIHNEQPVLGAVAIGDGRKLYNGMLVVPAYALTGALPANLLQHSDTFDLWTPIGATVSTDVSLDPVRGELTADRMVEAAGLTQHNLTPPNTNFVLGVTYTFSLYVKYETAAFIQLLLGSAAFGANAWGNFDIQNGALGTIGSSATGAVVDAGGGWYRISLTATATATAAAPAVIFGASAATMTRALSYTGSTLNTRLIANSQVEAGAAAGPYVRME